MDDIARVIIRNFLEDYCKISFEHSEDLTESLIELIKLNKYIIVDESQVNI